MTGIADEEEFFDQVVEAKRQNYHFIKVFLHRDRIGRGQKEILISGCVGLHAIKKGMGGIGGMAEYEFRTIQSDEMRFTFDRAEREYTCMLLDDQGPGYFSEVGFNRDLLASHLSEPYFIIKDVEVLGDIQKRYKFLQEHKGAKLARKKAPVLDNNSTSEDIDNQIKFLKEKKRLIQSTDTSQIPKLEPEQEVSVIEPLVDPSAPAVESHKPQIEAPVDPKVEKNAIRAAKQKAKRKIAREKKAAEANKEEPVVA